jgi:CBS-domain-containing membrane protein
MSLLRQGKAQMLIIYLGESDQWQGRPLYVAILQYAREAGCAGATVTRAVSGYGAGGRLHEQKSWHWSSDAPLIVQIVDQPARLARLLPQFAEMLQGGLITLHEVDVLKYTHARRNGISSSVAVRQVMETAVTTAQLDMPAAFLVEQLLNAPFRVLPVVDATNRLHGIVSTGDLITAGLLPIRRAVVRTAQSLEGEAAETIATHLEAAQHSTQTAQMFMNTKVRTIGPDQSIREAAQILIDTQLYTLPVIDATGKLCGILTRTDLLQAVRTSPLMSPEASSVTQPLSHTRPLPGMSAQQQPVSVYLNTEVVTVEEDTPLAETIDALITSPLKRVIVVNPARQVRGIISDVDVLARIQEQRRPRLLATLTDWARGKPMRVSPGPPHATHRKAPLAADVMNPQVVTIADTTSVQDAIGLMLTTHRKILPVIDHNQRLIGTVGRSDLLRVLVEEEQILQ